MSLHPLDTAKRYAALEGLIMTRLVTTGAIVFADAGEERGHQ